MSQTKVQLVEGLNINTAAPATALQIDSSGNINLDSNTLYVNATNNRVGIGTTSVIHKVNISNGTVTGLLHPDGTSNFGFGTYTNHPLVFYTNDSEKVRLDTSGRLLVGTSISASAGDAQYAKLQVRGNTNSANYSGILNLGAGATTPVSGSALGVIVFTDGTGSEYARIDSYVDATPGTNDYPGRLVFSTTADGASSPTERMRLDSSGNLKFNSGYGSVATAYGCRAWVSFDASSGTPTIQANGNISSITDNGVGQYTFNFTNSFPDANYCVVGMTQAGTSGVNDGGECARIGDRSTTSNFMSFTNSNETSYADNPRNCVLWMR